MACSPRQDFTVRRNKGRFCTVSTTASFTSSCPEQSPRWADLEDEADLLPAEPVSSDRGAALRGEAGANLPRLLGRLSGGNVPAVTLKVKNTFIEAYASEAEDEDEDLGLLPMGKSLTWSNSSAVDFTSDDDRSGDQLVGTTTSLQDLARERAQQAASAGRAADDDDRVEPEEHRRPQLSVGSAGHDAGDCRPCAWFWRSQGCINGVECRHCHLCPPSEAKKRRKANRLARRSHKATEGAPEDSSPAVTAGRR